jgi:pyruvate kinase
MGQEPVPQMNNEIDISIDDLNNLLATLDAYEKLLAHGKKSWKIMTKTERKKAVEAFDKIVELAKGFEV